MKDDIRPQPTRNRGGMWAVTLICVAAAIAFVVWTTVRVASPTAEDVPRVEEVPANPQPRAD